MEQMVFIFTGYIVHFILIGRNMINVIAKIILWFNNADHFWGTFLILIFEGLLCFMAGLMNINTGDMEVPTFGVILARGFGRIVIFSIALSIIVIVLIMISYPLYLGWLRLIEWAKNRIRRKELGL
jgi:hypothetical protein